MLKGLFGTGSVSHMLRGGLEEAAATHRTIGDRVASAMNASTHVDFPSELNQRVAKPSEADLERDMAALADTQLRYEAEARLLQAAYGQLRTAMKDRG